MRFDQAASAWADRLIGVTRMALSPDKNIHGYFHGTSACLSALLAAARYEEILELVEGDTFWPYKRWAVKALVAQGRPADALRYAEKCRNPWASDAAIDAACEQILLSMGDVDDAVRGLRADRESGRNLRRLVPGDREESTRTNRRRRSLPTSYGSRPATKANGSQQRRRPSCSTKRSR